MYNIGMEFIGWIGSVLLVVCGIPLAYESFKTGKSKAFDTRFGTMFLWMWGVGELLSLAYVVSFEDTKWPLIAMGTINTIMVSIILKFVYFPRKKIEKP